MARFAFTLDPSADVFPAMQPSLPGLRVGSAFQADVEGVASPPPGGGDSLRIVVREYRVLLK